MALKRSVVKDPFADSVFREDGISPGSEKLLSLLGVPFSNLNIFDNVLPAELGEYLARSDKPKRKKGGKKRGKKMKKKKQAEDRYITILKLAEQLTRKRSAKKRPTSKRANFVPLRVMDEPEEKKKRSKLRLLLPLLLLASLGGAGYLGYRHLPEEYRKKLEEGLRSAKERAAKWLKEKKEQIESLF